jgi:DNA-binding XRE family transcriptional regulator
MRALNVRLQNLNRSERNGDVSVDIANLLWKPEEIEMLLPTNNRSGDDLSAIAVLATFLSLEKSQQEALGKKVKKAVDPSISNEQRCRAKEAVLAALHQARGNAAPIRSLNREDCLSAGQRSLRERMDQQESQFAERLARLLAERQLTQADLARRLGVGQSAVSMLLTRKCRPQPRTLGKIAETLGVRVEDLWPGKVGP